jgi:hypothetical protein
MAEHDWESVGTYGDPISAGVASRRLTDEGVPNRIWVPPGSVGECFIWVAPECVDTAKQVLGEPPISGEELTALALKDPPPDDFAGPEKKQEAPISGPSRVSIAWLIAVLVIGLLGVLFFLYVPGMKSSEVARQRSPDGTADAVLVEVSQGAAGARNYRVCMEAANGIRSIGNDCTEIAYLGGVSADAGSQPVTLIWATPSHLQILYVRATSIHIYKPFFTWGARRRAPAGNWTQGSPMIFVQAVQSVHVERGPPGGTH